MKFKGILIVVKDCRKALKFYREMFGFELIRDNDGNMELSGNLYLQEEKYWERFTGMKFDFAVEDSPKAFRFFENLRSLRSWCLTGHGTETVLFPTETIKDAPIGRAFAGSLPVSEKETCKEAVLI